MRRKSEKDNWFCVVCGDKAKGLNFNALTCQSCKAFFRRNALSNKELKCLFENSCNIDKITRKFCSSCRLKKCFDKGMKKEWILTEEEKRLVREKIMQNRLRRQQLKQSERMISSNDSLVSHCSTHSMSPTTTFDDNSYDQINNVPSTLLDSHFNSIQHRFDSYDVRRYSERCIENLDELTFNSINLNLFQDIDVMNYHEINPDKSTTFPPISDFVNQLNVQRHEQLKESTKAFQSLNLHTNKNDVNSTMEYNFVENNETSFQYTKSNGACHGKCSFQDNFYATTFSPNLYVEKEPKKNQDYLRDYLQNCMNSYGSDVFNNIDPLMEFSTRFDLSTFPTYGGSFFSVKEKFILEELCTACTILHNPYKRMLIIKNQNYIKDSPHPCTLVDSFLHRLIHMTKRLSSFNSLHLDDQIQLLKFGLIEMLCLHSVLTFDPEFQGWKFLDDSCKLSIIVSMDAIKPCCIKYDYKSSVKNFYSNFKYEWKSDYVIFNLLTAIVLFTERPSVHEREKIRQEKALYTELLKHYLEMKYPISTEAHCSLDRLLLSMKVAQMVHQDILHIIASTSGSKFSPLLGQLMAQHKKQSLQEGEKEEEERNCNIYRLYTRFQNIYSEREFSPSKPENNVNASDSQQQSTSTLILDNFFCFS